MPRKIFDLPKDLKEYPERIHKELPGFLSNWLDSLEEAIVDVAPVGVSAEYKRSIENTRAKWRGKVLEGSVFSSVPYAQVIELGRRAGRIPPVAPLRLWAKRILGNEKAGFPVARAIGRRGLPARGIFAGVFRKSMPRFESALESFFDRVMR